MIRSARAITAASFLAMFFLGVSATLVGAAARQLGLSPSQIGIMLAFQNVGFGVAVLAAGALSDTHPKQRLLVYGSLLLGVSFFAFYVNPAFLFNLLVMALIGAGSGIYEGVADAMLFDLHERRSAFFVNMNHLFVTIGATLIALYLIFLQLRWRSALIQSGVVVVALAIIFALVRLPARGGNHISVADRFSALASNRLILLLFLAAVMIMGAETGAVGILTTFLVQERGLSELAAKFGLVIFLFGVATGRLIIGALVRPDRIWRFMLYLFVAATVLFSLLFLVELGPLTLVATFLAGVSMSALLPLVLSYAGAAFREMTGTVLGAVKLAIPVGGVILPLLMSSVVAANSLRTALILLPASLLLGLLLLMLAGRSRVAVPSASGA